MHFLESDFSNNSVLSFRSTRTLHASVKKLHYKEMLRNTKENVIN
jgi:head-tail adaptor